MRMFVHDVLFSTSGRVSTLNSMETVAGCKQGNTKNDVAKKKKKYEYEKRNYRESIIFSD